MLESNLVGGRQDLGEDPASLRYGVSITDACIDWEETERLLRAAYRELGAAARPKPERRPRRRTR